MKTSDFRHQSYPPQVMTSNVASATPPLDFGSEYPSPAEDDTPQTPYFNHFLPTRCKNVRIHSTEALEIKHPSLHREPKGPHVDLPPSTCDNKEERKLSDPPAMSTSPNFVSSFDGKNYYGSCDYDMQSIDQYLFHPYSPGPAQLAACKPSDLDARMPSRRKVSSSVSLNLKANMYSPHFPAGHCLNPHFMRYYELGDELGSGGYGFVMTACHRSTGYEVAVKFIIKKKVPDHAWVEDESFGRLPTEIMLLSCIDHKNIVKCLDVFEDPLYFYLVQELHGSPWTKYRRSWDGSSSTSTSSRSLVLSTPALSPSASTTSLSSSRGTSTSPPTPPDRCCSPILDNHGSIDGDPLSNTPTISARPRDYFRRPSHDLFECIEQSKNKRLTEKQARYVFSQIIDAVDYMDRNGIAHRDIKDENVVIDKDLKVKLIDFGSASIVDPSQPRPYYILFYGTTAYASPEILLKKDYQAAPAEIWTLGVLLSFLLTGTSPFPTVKDAIRGRIVLPESSDIHLSRSAMSLMYRCLDPDPQTRATIAEVKAHRWLR